MSIEEQSSTDPKIEKRKWDRPGGGGGESTIIYGNVFEKVGVNVSKVYGKFADSIINEIPGASESNGEFWASGISLVSHMQSPLIPAAHMNTRLLYTSKQWFGGGMVTKQREGRPRYCVSITRRRKRLFFSPKLRD